MNSPLIDDYFSFYRFARFLVLEILGHIFKIGCGTVAFIFTSFLILMMITKTAAATITIVSGEIFILPFSSLALVTIGLWVLAWLGEKIIQCNKHFTRSLAEYTGQGTKKH